MIYFILFLAVALGYVLAKFLYKKKIQDFSLLLAFSGSFLLAVTLFELLPEVYENSQKRWGLFIAIGIILQICLEFFSKGAEHGHVHLDKKTTVFPWLLFISLSIHAFLEGFPVHEGHNIFLGVLLHKIPIAMILTVFFIKAKTNNTTVLLFLGLFALMTPLGALVSEISKDVMPYKNEINALIIGIFLHVSTTILFESSKNHTFNLAKLTTIIVAMVLAYFL